MSSFSFPYFILILKLQERYLATPHEGCLLTIFDVGAYCASMGSNYNMRVSIKLAMTCDFQQCSILTSVDSDEHLQPLFKPRNSK